MCILQKTLYLQKITMMEKLFERHYQYLTDVPMAHFRQLMHVIDWDSRLIIIKGPKGVGKSTLMKQYIKKNFTDDDSGVLYCSADSGYFATHSLVDTAEKFVMNGGHHLFIDEIHKYKGWSSEIKEIYDLFHDLHIVLSGSSLLRLNDGDTDLSRRMVSYEMSGLSFREFLFFEKGMKIDMVDFDTLLKSPNKYCSYFLSVCKHPLPDFRRYLRAGYYPFYFENKPTYQIQVENVVDYIVNTELPAYRNVETGNTRKIKALLQILAHMVPYEIDINKLSKACGFERGTTLRYLKLLEEAQLIRRLFQNLDTITDLQKPDKILLDNPNLIVALSDQAVEIGTVRESFFCNQIASIGKRIEYGGLKSGDFKIDENIVVEVGGADKGYRQIKGEPQGFIAADDIEMAVSKKIPLWAFGCLF